MLCLKIKKIVFGEGGCGSTVGGRSYLRKEAGKHR